MVIQCPDCQAKYKYPEEKFGGEPTKKVKCTKCGGTFEIQSPSVKPKSVDDTTGSVSRTKRFSSKKDSISPEDAALRGIPMLPDDRKLSISIMDGPLAGTVYLIDKPSVSIGRANADLSLNDPEASRLHAQIDIYGNKYMLKDLESTNGTFVGKKRITEAQIENLTEFRVGSTPMMFIETKPDE